MKTLSFLIAFLLATVNSCQKDDPPPGEYEYISLDEKSARLIEADNTFGLKIFKKIREESNEENIMISPLSISVALTMAYNGADGDTKTEMKETLELNGLTTEEINNSYKTLIGQLQEINDEEVTFKIANAIFYADIFTVKPEFLNVNKDVYDAEIEELDFSLSESVNRINNWVADKTNDKIKKIIEQLDPLDRMVLLNAIYFNGIWTSRFPEEGILEDDFKKSDGSTLKTIMMNKLDTLSYANSNLFEAVKIPYGNGHFNMVVFLPSEGNNSQDVIDELNSDKWKSWMESFIPSKRVNITIPKFKFAFESGLNDVLKSMNMKKAFSADEADFPGITEEDLYISAVLHKSFIDVNEKGTEAAAVTGVVFSTTSIGEEPPTIQFKVDKPFVFAITEEDTGAILFIGEVNNPEYN